MTNGQSNLPVCVHCGTPRPADEPICPNCGKPWIDELVESDEGAVPPPPPPADETAAAAAAAVSAASALDDTGEFSFDDWTLPPEKPRSKAVWLIPILLLIGLGVVWAMVFLDSGTATTTTLEAAPSTTEAPTTTSASTTTSAPDTTTTSSTTTTTTVPWPQPDAWSAVGDPIAPEDLPLKAAGIGDLDFGLPIAEAAGRLTASFGEAELAGVDGVCGPEEGYWLQWGELQATFDGYAEDSTFVSYRYADVGSDTSLGLATLSGLVLGDTVGTLKAIYNQFTITFEVIDNRDHFRLLDGGELLLWGPVTSPDDDGIVEGIYSPSPCDDG